MKMFVSKYKNSQKSVKQVFSLTKLKFDAIGIQF